MNYKKLLKNTVLGVGAMVTANNTIFAITLEEFLKTPQGQEVRQMVKRGNLVPAENLLLQAGFNNPNQIINNLRVTLDPFHKQVVAQYLNDKTLVNLMQVSKANRYIAGRMRKNPVSITDKNKALYSQIQTQQIFEETDLILDENSDVVIYQIQHEVNGINITATIEEIYENNPNTQSIIFENIAFEDTEDIEEVFNYLQENKYDVSFGTINLFFDEFENDEEALQKIQRAKEQDSFLKLKKIVFNSAIPFNTYTKLKQNPLCHFYEVTVDLESNDKEQILKQIEELETNLQVENITFRNKNDDFFINLLGSSAYKLKQADCVHSQAHTLFKNFFCTIPLLWREATFDSMKAENFYGVDLKNFEYCSSFNPNEDVFQGSNIGTFYLPFFEYDIDSLFSLVTALDCINHDSIVWLPFCENIDTLRQLMQKCMEKVLEEDDEDYTFDIEKIVNADRIKFYTEEQLKAIKEQRTQFYNFVRRNFLEKYMQYINFDNRPEWLTQHEWDNCVLPIKAEAEKLMAVMRCEKLPEEKSYNSNGMNELIAAAMELSLHNEGLIADELANRYLMIQNVTGDGNCGIYALLAGLHPDQAGSYSQVTNNSQAWQNAANLRQELFGNANALGQMVDGHNQLDRWLALDNNEALQAVNTYVRSQGRSSLVILDTTVTAESGAAFTVVDANGEQIPYNTLTDALNAGGNNPLILVYTPNHWKAVVPNNN